MLRTAAIGFSRVLRYANTRTHPSRELRVYNITHVASPLLTIGSHMTISHLSCSLHTFSNLKGIGPEGRGLALMRSTAVSLFPSC